MTVVRYTLRYGDVAIGPSNATINARIRYGNSAHMGGGCKQKLSTQNCD